MFKSIFKCFIFSNLCFLFFNCYTTKKTTKEDNLSLPLRRLGKITASIVKRNSKELLPREYSFVLITQNGKLRIHHKLLGDNIWIFIEEKDRKTLISAIENYLENYKQGFHRDNKKKAYFGKVPSQMVWGLLNAAHAAEPTMRFEYEYLKNGKPYFIIANATVESIKKDSNCPAVKIAFSPAQCKKVLALIGEENISSVVQSIKKDFEQYDEDDDFEEENDEVLTDEEFD
ncbi:MAG: hypothetical protein ACTTJ3_04565 [Treponema sp.]